MGDEDLDFILERASVQTYKKFLEVHGRIGRCAHKQDMELLMEYVREAMVDLGWRKFGEDGKDSNRDLNRALPDREAWDDEEEEAAQRCHPRQDERSAPRR